MATRREEDEIECIDLGSSSSSLSSLESETIKLEEDMPRKKVAVVSTLSSAVISPPPPALKVIYYLVDCLFNFFLLS